MACHPSQTGAAEVVNAQGVDSASFVQLGQPIPRRPSLRGRPGRHNDDHEVAQEMVAEEPEEVMQQARYFLDQVCDSELESLIHQIRPGLFTHTTTKALLPVEFKPTEEVPQEGQPTKEVPQEVQATQEVPQQAIIPPGTKLECILQWSSGIYYVSEDEGAAEVQIQRLGPSKDPCSVKYFTKDSSAKAGVRYEAQSGTVHFAPGEMMKTINIEIFQDDCFDATLEFHIKLDDAEGAFLGLYLHTARVQVVDDDGFPSNRCRSAIKEAETKKKKPSMMSLDRRNTRSSFGSKARLEGMMFIDYVRLNLRNKVVRKGFHKLMMVDVVKNIYFLWVLYLNKYMMDEIIKGNDSSALIIKGDRLATMACVVVLLLVPFVFIHFLNVRSMYWKVGGASRKMLSTNLMRRFLNYSEDAHREVQSGGETDLMMTIVRDVKELVSGGFMGVRALAGDVQQVVGLFLFQFLVAADDEGDSADPLLISIHVIIPLFFAWYLFARRKASRKIRKHLKEAEDNQVQECDTVLSNIRLIIDYAQRTQTAEAYDKMVDASNRAIRDSSLFALNSAFIAPLLGNICCWLYLCYGLQQIMNETTTIGSFLMNLTIIKSIGKLWGDMYTVLMKIQSTMPSLNRITRFMNLPVDTLDAMHQHRQEQKTSTRKSIEMSHAQMTTSQNNDNYVVDRLKVRFKDVEFEFRHGVHDTYIGLTKCTFKVEQGHLAAFIGARGAGKSTLLKLLAKLVAPSSGQVFIPAHLRALHVPQEPMFLNAPLIENLTFGCEQGSPDTRPERVERICKHLGLPEHIIGLLDSDKVVGWKSVLSATECCLLHIARALVFNPELLILHTPTVMLNDAAATRVLNTLQKYVRNHGLEKDPTKKHLRRPRTCIFTASRTQAVKAADKVYQITQSGIQEIDPKSVEAAFLSANHDQINDESLTSGDRSRLPHYNHAATLHEESFEMTITQSGKQEIDAESVKADLQSAIQVPVNEPFLVEVNDDRLFSIDRIRL